MGLRGRRNLPNQEDEKIVEISAQMQGSLIFKDPINLKINGEFTGSLDTKGTLSIGSAATIAANITGDNIVIAGKIDGDIVANKCLPSCQPLF